ncbi:Aste57867_1095 [Aphanomyces stellatus]|uniref:Aste57867_1095 protein n=1 Tax=Aphanomyces stellatus TaxID=120398 RepID=A0A485K9T2_9STRA|nr:hypothetical protein As57867_001094 [Aphanomyces stellatus]VFT78317.1 Aste57867_1095 [Aphanomyces stellatus]
MSPLNDAAAFHTVLPSTLGDAMLWLMVPSITSIMVVAAFVFHHIRHQDDLKRKKAAHRCTAAPHFGHGLNLADVTNPSTSIAFNSRTPIPIDTPLFEGQAHVLVRNPDGDSHWDPLFEGKRRTIWVMVQGTFKRAPRGTVYVAGELPRSMQLTFWAKTLVSMMITSAQTLMGSMHFSFGDDTESPHVALPLYQSADTMIATPQDEVPPKLGTAQWDETAAQRAARKRTPVGTECFRTDMVYSFQFHTMHVDLPSWSIVNLPGIQDVSLKSFLGDMSLRLGVYEHVDTAPSLAHATKDYCFCFDISSSPAPPPLDKLDLPEVDFDAWMWLEHFDAATGLRPVSYLFRVLQDDMCSAKTVVVSSNALAAVLAVDSPADASALLTRARREHYQALDEQTVDVNRQLHAIAAHGSDAAKRELVLCLASAAALPSMDVSAKAMGVNVWRWDLNVCREGSGYRVVSDTFLRHEYLVLTSTDVLLYRTYASTPAKKVPVNHITDVTTRLINDMPVVGIHTWTDVVYVHVADPDAWKDAIVAASERSSVLTSSVSLKALNLQCWTPFNVVTYEGQLVLNSRKLVGSPSDDSTATADPIAVAMACVDAGLSVWSSRARRLEFARATQALRLVDLAALDTPEKKLVFLLNVYQALLMHATLVLPRLTTTAMHQCAYELGLQKLVLSLAEIEHVLLRAAAPQLGHVPYLDFVPDAAAYPAAFGLLALPHRDFRVSCALHAHRAHKHLVVYSVDGVHAQLSDVVGTYLRQHVRVAGPATVTLPVVCKWYQVDFGHQILRKTMGFLADDTIAAIQDVADHPKFALEFRDSTTARPSPQWMPLGA